MTEDTNIPDVAESKTTNDNVSYETYRALVEKNREITVELNEQREEIYRAKSELAAFHKSIHEKRTHRMYPRHAYFHEIRERDDRLVEQYKQLLNEQIQLLDSQAKAIAEAKTAAMSSEYYKKEADEFHNQYWEMRRQRDLLLNDAKYRENAIKAAEARRGGR